MIRSAAVAAVFAVFALSPPQAGAQDAGLLDSARRYVELPANVKLVDEMLAPDQVSKQILMSLGPRAAGLSAAQKAIIINAVVGALTDFKPRLRELMIETVAAQYDAEEIEAMVAFYGSPVGGRILAKGPAFMLAFQQKMQGELGPMLQARVGPAVIKAMKAQ